MGLNRFPTTVSSVNKSWGAIIVPTSVSFLTYETIIVRLFHSLYSVLFVCHMLLVYLMHIKLFFHSLQIISVLLYILFARVERFELPSKVLETRMLPLHHTRVCDPYKTRTCDSLIKSEVLYQLS